MYRNGLEAALDWALDVRTNSEIDLSALGVDGPNRHRYAPCRWTTLRKILPRAEVGADDVFVDFGSGKGRALLQAASYPFRRVVGVEISADLNVVARANIASRRHRLVCRDIEIIDCDVLKYTIPDDLTVAFLYNPFGGAVFESVIARLLASWDRHPRRIRIIYRNPVEEASLLATGRIQQVRSSCELGATYGSQWRSLRMYEVRPPPDRS